MKAYRYMDEDAYPLRTRIHVDEEASRAFPERTCPHVHLARSTAFVKLGDYVLVSDLTDEPIAVLTPEQALELERYFKIGIAINTTGDEPAHPGGSE